jgi:molybdopterin converting factor subunit 1
VRIQVLYFGVLKEFSGGERDSVEVAEGGTVAELVGLLRGRVAREAKVWGSLAVAVNREYAGLGTVLRDGDEVALLPPVSGGCA